MGVIVDEGNNWKRSCPVYTATISCDPEFHWRIQFVGQDDCEGKKTGESIWELVKDIFIVAGLLAVYMKIVSAGTDGASVMRSSAVYRGKWCIICLYLFIDSTCLYMHNLQVSIAGVPQVVPSVLS